MSNHPQPAPAPFRSGHCPGCPSFRDSRPLVPGEDVCDAHYSPGAFNGADTNAWDDDE